VTLAAHVSSSQCSFLHSHSPLKSVLGFQLLTPCDSHSLQCVAICDGRGQRCCWSPEQGRHYPFPGKAEMCHSRVVKTQIQSKVLQLHNISCPVSVTQENQATGQDSQEHFHFKGYESLEHPCLVSEVSPALQRCPLVDISLNNSTQVHQNFALKPYHLSMSSAHLHEPGH